MNQHQPSPFPTVEEFLAQTEPDDTDEEPTLHDLELAVGPGMLWQIPPDPMERIATALEAIAGGRKEARSRTVSYDDVTVTEPVDYAQQDEALQLSYEKLADAEDQLKTMGDVISNVEAALGKSTAKPALAARAVIEAWRKGPAEPEQVDEHDPYEDQPGPDPADKYASIEGHTRAEVEEGAPAICQECSYSAQDYVVWPCVGAQVEVGTIQQAPQQPEHTAPVEVWREYARSLGFAGPEIDNANRSQIRTALGVAQPVSSEGGA